MKPNVSTAKPQTPINKQVTYFKRYHFSGRVIHLSILSSVAQRLYRIFSHCPQVQSMSMERFPAEFFFRLLSSDSIALILPPLRPKQITAELPNGTQSLLHFLSTSTSVPSAFIRSRYSLSGIFRNISKSSGNLLIIITFQITHSTYRP